MSRAHVLVIDAPAETKIEVLVVAAIASLAGPGDCIGVEALTYPFVKVIAAQLGIRLIPLAMDKSGVLPTAITDAKEKNSIKAVYLQPSLQSPLAITMDIVRRREIAAALEGSDVIYVDSLSKNVTRALTLATLAVPPRFVEQTANALRSGAWTATGLAVAMGGQWMNDRTAESIGQSKRIDAAARQKIARTVLVDLEINGEADHFSKSAVELGIAVMPSSAFAVKSRDASAAVRLA